MTDKRTDDEVCREIRHRAAESIVTQKPMSITSAELVIVMTNCSGWFNGNNDLICSAPYQIIDDSQEPAMSDLDIELRNLVAECDRLLSQRDIDSPTNIYYRATLKLAEFILAHRELLGIEKDE